MVLAFKIQFKNRILDKSKIHTIRQDSSNRWSTGKTIHFATGVRTKNYDCFRTGQCLSVQTIEIKKCLGSITGKPLIYIEVDGKCLDTYNPELKISSFGQIDALAINDGFNTVDEFLSFFEEDFKGKIIHWTNLTY